MNDQPPDATVIAATTEVLELASLLDNRIAAPDKARILAWAKQIGRHPNMHRDDLLDAVQAFYDRPSPQPVSVGDVIEGARRTKRDRLDREADIERDQRAADLAVKADTESIAAAVSFGRTRKRTSRLEAAERGLHVCVDRPTAIAAFREFAAAKAEANK